MVSIAVWQSAHGAEPPPRVYRNTLTPIENPEPLLADYPQYVQPVEELHRFEAPILVDDADADIDVRAWRFSYNARGIIEVPNRLDGGKTAIIVVHPWGIDDGQGWKMPEPAGVAFACTFEKNDLVRQHAAEVINPFLEAYRDDVAVVLYSLPGPADDIRTRLYRSTTGNPSDEERSVARDELTKKLNAFDYRGEPVPAEIPLTGDSPVVDYFQAFRGIDSSARYNGEGFWELPIPVMTAIDVHHDDVVLYDEQGYPELKRFLQSEGIEHILLCGYATDMCVCRTTAGYENLRQDFNVFLVGDATQATCPANVTSAYATNQSLSYAALDLFITQVSHVRRISEE
jgi:nicotinamidase-related amidase